MSAGSPDPVAGLQAAARRLSEAVADLRFGAPVHTTYNPLEYAWPPHAQYLQRYGGGRKRFVLLGMNPGPYGMMQTGVPFGEVAHVRDWMGIEAPVSQPARMHPKRPIEGFACSRSEVSGRRLWGWAAARFGTPDAFFARAFVLNYCPLVFLEAGGRNITPDKLPAHEREPLERACDQHLREVIALLAPEWAIGVGSWATRRLQHALPQDGGAGGRAPRIGQVLHPSPASPLANRGWSEAAQAQLAALGVSLD